MGVSRILILDADRLRLRKVTRVLTCTEAELFPLEDPTRLPALLDGTPAILCTDAVNIATVVGVLQTRPEVTAVVWTADQTDKLLRHAQANPGLSHLLGRVGDAPRSWELLWTVRRLMGQPDPSLAGVLAWGHTGFKKRVCTPAQRDATVEAVVRFCGQLNTTQRLQQQFGELAHELLMNALYDAPVDDAGRPLYADDRRAAIELPADQAAVLRCGSDGERLALSVTDPFGRLKADQVFSGIARGLAGGEMDTRGGGAGLGMVYIYRSAAICSFEVEPGRQTRVMGLYELDMNQRTFRSLPRSLHVFGGR